MTTIADDYHIELLISAEEIQTAVQRLIPEIKAIYRNTEEITALILLEGAKWFAKDLLTGLNNPKYQPSELKVSSYFGTTQSSGRIEMETPPPMLFSQRHILIIDDIYDTGRTLHAVKDYLHQAGAASVRTCVMFTKERKHEEPVNIDFSGMTILDNFVVGYGLDYEDRYRDLPYVGVLTQKKSKSHKV